MVDSPNHGPYELHRHRQPLAALAEAHCQSRKPVTLKGTVAFMMFRAGTFWPLMTNSVAPCLGAGTGVTGQSNASYS